MTLVLDGFQRGLAATEHLKPFVPAGSVQSSKGEASDEDEETEYFDAMEDAPAFITVTADPKHHRYEPLPRGMVKPPEHVARVCLVLCLGFRAASHPEGE